MTDDLGDADAPSSTVQRLRDDASLKQPNWDSYGSAPVADAALDAAELIMRRWDAVPTSYGGVQLELHSHGYNVEIELTPDGKIEEVYVRRAAPPDGDPAL